MVRLQPRLFDHWSDSRGVDLTMNRAERNLTFPWEGPGRVVRLGTRVEGTRLCGAGDHPRHPDRREGR